MNKQEQPQPKKVNVGKGTYVRLVISGTMLLLGGLIFEYSSTTSHLQGESAAFGALVLWATVVLPLCAIGGVLFVIGVVRLGKQKPRSPILVLLGALIVGLPVIGGVIAQSPLFLGPYPLLTYGPSGYIWSIAWSPDGKYIASTDNSADYAVQVWDATTGNLKVTYRGYSSPVYAVAWSPDGRRIASGSDDGTVQVWDAVDGGHVFTYRGHSNAVSSVAWSPDGTRIVSGSYDDTVQVWDAITGQTLLTYRGHSDAPFVAWSPDSKYITSASDGGDSVVVWDAVSGRTITTYQQRDHRGVAALAWSPKDSRIASGYVDGTLQVWDATSGSTITTYQRYYGGVFALAWSPDGKRIACGYDDGTVIWNAS